MGENVVKARLEGETAKKFLKELFGIVNNTEAHQERSQSAYSKSQQTIRSIPQK